MRFTSLVCVAFIKWTMGPPGHHCPRGGGEAKKQASPVLFSIWIYSGSILASFRLRSGFIMVFSWGTLCVCVM